MKTHNNIIYLLNKYKITMIRAAIQAKDICLLYHLGLGRDVSTN